MISWNIESVVRNIFNLKYFLDKYLPDMVFLSEPQAYSCNLDLAAKPLSGSYNFELNSKDKLDPDIPLMKTKAHGGTMILWKAELDPYVAVHPVSSTAFLPVIFDPPGALRSIHIAVYLPTLGHENEFVDELSKLTHVVKELNNQNPDSPVFLRGDFNVNQNQKKRMELLNHFCSELSLHQVCFPKPTYHHFLGDGKSDSYLDRILCSTLLPKHEAITSIECKLDNPLIDSHHDLIVSTYELPNISENESETNENIVAPTVPNNRKKVIWSDEGIECYQKLVSPELSRIQSLYLSSPSPTSHALLLEATNNVLISSAVTTNKTFPLKNVSSQRPSRVPAPIKISQKALLREYKALKYCINDPNYKNEEIEAIKANYKESRDKHRKLVRSIKAKDVIERDEKLFSILSSNPSKLFKSIKRSKRARSSRITKLLVDDKIYLGNSVKDGFFDSISNLKTVDQLELNECDSFHEFSLDYQNIMEISKDGPAIPTLTEKQSFELIQRMKPDVSDFHGLTLNHFIFAGPAGWRHFNLLLNSLISNINITSIKEINVVHAIVLFKGHKKNRNLDRSYRTISTCIVVAKALDLYVRDLHIEAWNNEKADVQFQGEGSSHDLAAVLLTETIQHSLYSLQEPIYVLYLDAKSAFDNVLREILIRNLFNCGTFGHSLIYFDNRLKNRQTFIEWEDQIMGPILDQCGLEQGGISSSDLYKIYGREQLTTSQDSHLGVKLGNLSVSAIGIADDTALLSNKIQNLQFLVHLTEVFCKKYHVAISAEKTKLQVYYTSTTEIKAKYAKMTNPIKINNEKIEFEECAEHVGMVRSTSGNNVPIFSRISAHKRALAAVLHTGIARGHRGNPVASLRVEQLYGVPVLLSGLSALVTTKVEENLVESHHKETLSNLQRFLPGTPRSVVYFLAGSLPGSALLHLRKLSIFGMICRRPNNILWRHATNILEQSTISKKSWFHQIRDICLKYDLPHPKKLLDLQLTKDKFKKLVKSKIVDFWQSLLRKESELLPSLCYFSPYFMSLTKPHPVWWTAGSSPAKISMATVQSWLISGRYRTQKLCSHWTTNGTPFCLLSEACSAIEEDISHFLETCVALQQTRTKLYKFTEKYCMNMQVSAAVQSIVTRHCTPLSATYCQFLIDCSVLPDVVCAVQTEGKDVLRHLFAITRTWVYTLHKERMKLLGRWNHL